jgi:hypothetical protein
MSSAAHYIATSRQVSVVTMTAVGKLRVCNTLMRADEVPLIAVGTGMLTNPTLKSGDRKRGNRQ